MKRQYKRTGLGTSTGDDRRIYNAAWMRDRRQDAAYRRAELAKQRETPRPARRSKERCFSCIYRVGLQPIERMQESEAGELVPVTVMWCGKC